MLATPWALGCCLGLNVCPKDLERLRTAALGNLDMGTRDNVSSSDFKERPLILSGCLCGCMEAEWQKYYAEYYYAE